MILVTALNRKTLANTRDVKPKNPSLMTVLQLVQHWTWPEFSRLRKVQTSLISFLRICASLILFSYLLVVSQEDGLNCEVLESFHSTLDLCGRDSPSVRMFSELSNVDPLPNLKRPAAVIRNQNQVSVQDASTHASMSPIMICIFSNLIAANMF